MSDETPACEQLLNTDTSYSSTTVSVLVSTDLSGCSSGLSTGAIVGIALGAVVGGILLVLVIVLLVRAHRHRQMRDANVRIKQRGPNFIEMVVMGLVLVLEMLFVSVSSELCVPFESVRLKGTFSVIPGYQRETATHVISTYMQRNDTHLPQQLLAVSWIDGSAVELESQFVSQSDLLSVAPSRSFLTTILSGGQVTTLNPDNTNRTPFTELGSTVPSTFAYSPDSLHLVFTRQDLGAVFTDATQPGPGPRQPKTLRSPTSGPILKVAVDATNTYAIVQDNTLTAYLLSDRTPISLLTGSELTFSFIENSTFKTQYFYPILESQWESFDQNAAIGQSSLHHVLCDSISRLRLRDDL